jgi:acetyltransferase-like isoleucine patch superfamily enzyme
MTRVNEDSNKRTLRDVLVGDNVKIFDFVNAYECTIGSNTKVGTFVEIQKGVIIGENCKISSHTFICEGVTLGNGVFVGHNVSFINDLHPRAVNDDGSVKGGLDWKMAETIIEDGASIGTSATILGGLRIGRNAIVGAGALVTKNVPEDTVVVGNPARVLRKIEREKDGRI